MMVASVLIGLAVLFSGVAMYACLRISGEREPDDF